MEKQNFRVLIVGGGIAGPALALALNQVGIETAVFEAYAYGEGIGGGFNIAPNGMDVLDKLGLKSDLVARTTRARTSIFRDEFGRQMARLPYGDEDRFGQPALSMSRATLFECLACRMKEQGIRVEYEKRLTSIREDASGVTAYFADGASERGDILIGADGVRSAVRRAILPDGPKPEFTGMLGVGGFVSRSLVPELREEDLETITFTFGARGFFGHGGGDKDTILWWANTMSNTPFSSEEIGQIDLDTVRTELLERFGHYYQPIPQILSRTPKIMRMNTFDIQSLPTWHKGRVLLIGDAAHAVSPNSGQGASLALEDALFLAKLLKENSGPVSIEGVRAIFTRFEAGRKDRVEKIIQEGRRRSRGKEVVSPFQSKIRNIFIGLMIRLFGSKDQDWLFGYKVDWPYSMPGTEASFTSAISREDLKMRATRPGYP